MKNSKLKKYISKDTYLIEEALEKVLEFSSGPPEPLRSVIKGLEEFLKMNEVKDNEKPKA